VFSNQFEKIVIGIKDKILPKALRTLRFCRLKSKKNFLPFAIKQIKKDKRSFEPFAVKKNT
jgi:hypothetical protein